MSKSYSAAYEPPTDPGPPQPPQAAGWIIFTGMVIAILGVVNGIYGLAAISGSAFFAKRADYMTGDLETWGWVILIIGLVQLSAAFAIWRGAAWGRVLGVAIAALNAIVQLMWLPAQPLAALALYALDLVVIYGLVRYGGGRMTEAS
jgi:hypothetical protein